VRHVSSIFKIADRYLRAVCYDNPMICGDMLNDYGYNFDSDVVVPEDTGGLRACAETTSRYVNPSNGVHAVDGLLTGLHDPVTSHLAMLSAIEGLGRIRSAYADAIEHRYLWHEFGDSHLIWRQPPN